MNIGIAGEVRCVVSHADGSVKADTGFQKNLILDGGLDFFGGSTSTSPKNTIFSSCVIGAGNSTPSPEQNQLDSFIARAEIRAGALYAKENDYIDDGSGVYRTSLMRQYRFAGLSNVNITEVGLSHSSGTDASYELDTRALIKDSLGNPTTIQLEAGEILDVYYKIWQVFSTADILNTVSMLDGKGGAVAYNTVARLSAIGNSNSIFGAIVGDEFNLHRVAGYTAYVRARIFTGELRDILNTPLGMVGSGLDANTFTLSNYTKGSFERTIIANFRADDSNTNIRGIYLPTSMGGYQIRFGSVTDDSPITKTDQFKLSMPFKFSWGRYEGEL